MKTVEMLFNEIKNNEELKLKLKEALNASKLGEFMKEQGCDAEVSELVAYAKAQAEKANCELSAEELESVAGGANWEEALLSVFSLGICCVIETINSANGSGVGDGPDGQILCNDPL